MTVWMCSTTTVLCSGLTLHSLLWFTSPVAFHLRKCDTKKHNLEQTQILNEAALERDLNECLLACCLGTLIYQRSSQLIINQHLMNATVLHSRERVCEVSNSGEVALFYLFILLKWVRKSLKGNKRVCTVLYRVNHFLIDRWPKKRQLPSIW